METRFHGLCVCFSGNFGVLDMNILPGISTAVTNSICGIIISHSPGKEKAVDCCKQEI